MNKKAISPLIATILIIGFTVALAAVIMTWGQKFARDIQVDTEKTADTQIKCATDVVFDFESACQSVAGGYKITVVNNGKEDILGFKARLYKSGDDVGTATGAGVTSYDSESFNLAGIETGYETGVKKIEIFPEIAGGITCSGNTDSFGDVDGNAIASCPT